MNTNLAAAGGVIACMIASKLTNSHTNISATLNGAIAGLVAITAEPLAPSYGTSYHHWSDWRNNLHVWNEINGHAKN